MKDDIPERLRPIRDILMDSARGPAEDEAPGPPAGLLDDLEKTLMDEQTERARPQQRQNPSLFEKITKLFATPALGVAAALLVVLFVSIPMFEGLDDFRNDGKQVNDGASIVLVAADDAAYDSLLSLGLDEGTSIERVDTVEAAQSIPAPKVVVDFPSGQITAYDAEGNSSHPVPLPDDPADQATAVTQALHPPGDQ